MALALLFGVFALLLALGVSVAISLCAAALATLWYLGLPPDVSTLKISLLPWMTASKTIFVPSGDQDPGVNCDRRASATRGRAFAPSAFAVDSRGGFPATNANERLSGENGPGVSRRTEFGNGFAARNTP